MSGEVSEKQLGAALGAQMGGYELAWKRPTLCLPARSCTKAVEGGSYDKER